MADSGSSRFQSAQDKNIVLPILQVNEKAFRLEIDELLGDNALTNLFILGLAEIKKDSIKDPKTNEPNWWSFYSLGAIHGLPKEPWSGYENSTQYGYCHHGLNTFPTWHRPYMFQFEQAVYNKMAAIAAQYTDVKWKQIYTDALDRFRLPYWDPCMPRNKVTGTTVREKMGRWGFPVILKTKDVYVRLPENPNELTPVPNPLYRFDFPDAEEFAGVTVPRPQINWQEAGLGWRQDARGNWNYDQNRFRADITTRGPTASPDNARGDSNYNFLELNIQRQVQESATSLWHLLNPAEVGIDEATGQEIKINDLRAWDVFAKHHPDNGALSRQSLESWHDNIHNLVGTGVRHSGHMSDPSVAAFDPVFWMHHCNIDRLLALFQALYPDKFVTPGKRDPATAGQDQNILADDALFPFRKNEQDECWTSTDLRDWAACGFAVPGTRPLDKDAQEKNQLAVAQYLRDTYYWATDGSADPPNTLHWPRNLDHVEALTGKNEDIEEAPALEVQAISLEAGEPQLVLRTVPLADAEAAIEEQPILPEDNLQVVEQNTQNLPQDALIDADKPAVPTKMRTWNAHIRVKKYAYDQSFLIHFFIGHVKDEQPERYLSKMNEVGFSGVFASSARANCASCKKHREQDFMYEDVVPLTSKLMDYITSEPRSSELIRDGVKKTIDNLEPEEVVPFLKEHLQWRITDTSSNLLGHLEDSGLEIKVSDRLFEPPNADNLLGTYGRSEVHHDITHGKLGGYSLPASA